MVRPLLWVNLLFNTQFLFSAKNSSTAGHNPLFDLLAVGSPTSPKVVVSCSMIYFLTLLVCNLNSCFNCSYIYAMCQ